MLRRRVQRIEFGATSRALLLITAASAALAGSSYGVWIALDHALGRSLGAQLVSLCAGIAVGLAAYLISCFLLGVRELDALLGLRARFRRA